jgi:hypothetical protein
MRFRLRAFVALVTTSLMLAVPAAGVAAPRHQHPTNPRLERLYEPYTGTVGDPGCKRSVPGICWKFYSGHFAIPACMVNDESHGLLHEHSHPWSSSGLYQLLLSNWDYYKQPGWPAFPYEGSKLQQSIVATDVLRSQGIHAWSTAAGCGY